MKTLLFREMLLVSYSEKSALRVKFHPKATVIRGENQTGKSSIIKTILLTFGAMPAKVHPKWTGADVRSLVKFDVDGRSFALLRHGNTHAAYDGRNNLVARFGSVTNELAPFLAKEFAFGLRLPDRSGKFVPLPPAYYFLPFYMDQDDGWTSQWSGFAKLEQFANWKKGLVEYHAGIRGNTYYEAQAAKLDAEADLAKLDRKHEGLKGIYDGLRDRLEQAQFDIDFDAYRQEVDELLQRCERLRQVEERFKARLTALRNQREATKTQLDITNHAREEARKDYDYATVLGDSDEVHCPTCGAGYSNAFAERFSIALDEDQCADLALRLSSELSDIEAKIEGEVRLAREAAMELGRIEKLLAKREGEIAIGDLIRQEGRRELRDVMHRDLGSLEAEAGKLRFTIEEKVKRIRALDSREHRRTVNAAFEQHARRFLSQLDVSTIPDKNLSKVDGKLATTGSENPRALLAYKMAFFHVLRQFGSAVSAPFIIDSPNQQDQDPRHLERMLRFVNEQRPPDSQLILGAVSTSGIDFGGDEIVLTRKYSALSEDQFSDVAAEMSEFIDRAL